MMHKELILASNSPRRKELMVDCGYAFRVESADIEERLDTTCPIETAIEQVAYQKAEAVLKIFPDAVVLGCDTMVIHDGIPLGKPKNKEDAEHMLRQLGNQTHRVISGVAILSKEQSICFHESSEVSFYPIDEDFLQEYLNSKEPYDKAGAYGIQGKGKLLVKKIHGDYYNVMGLPIAKVYRELKKLIKNQ